jgi:two-component system, response regulator PdtaR
VSHPRDNALLRLIARKKVDLFGAGEPTILEDIPKQYRAIVHCPARTLLHHLGAPRAIMTVILIVEDDILANEHLEFILQRAGYEVLSATSADEAVELLEDHPDVQLLVTDINLPGTTNGLKLAATTKARRPDMNIIIVTGYSAPKSNEIPSGSLFVAKPYSARKMIEAVRHFQ